MFCEEVEAIPAAPVRANNNWSVCSDRLIFTPNIPGEWERRNVYLTSFLLITNLTWPSGKYSMPWFEWLIRLIVLLKILDCTIDEDRWIFWSLIRCIYVNNVYDWRYAPEPSDPASRCWAGVLAECGEASLLSAWPVQRSVICFVSVNYVPPRAQLPIRGRRRTPLSSRGGLTTLDRAALVTLALTPGSGTHGSQL